MALRQTQGFMDSIIQIMKAALAIPDYSTISKRSINLPKHVLDKVLKPGSVVIVDSSGLKVGPAHETEKIAR
jgi:hypothetical protein